MEHKKNYNIAHLVCFAMCMMFVCTGCITPKTYINLYSRTTQETPALQGKTIAVLPSLGIDGSYTRIVSDFDSSINTVFASDIAGISFKSPQSLMTTLQQNPRSYVELSRKMSQSLPAHIVYDEKESKLIFDSNIVAGKTLDTTYFFAMNSATASYEKAPGQLDIALCNALESDYTLVSVPFHEYLKTSQVLTFFGILPFAGAGGMRHTMHGVFALYENETGKKVWEGQLGLRTVNASPVRDIALGAAYLVTGNVEIPLDRVLAQEESKK